mgnify:CR=1 FL=1
MLGGRSLQPHAAPSGARRKAGRPARSRDRRQEHCRRVAGGGRYIDPDLADRMVFEVGLTDSRPLHSLLSEREFSVFERLAQGANVNDIAQQLALSNKTISTHKARLMQKLNVNSLAELVKYAMEHKLV